MHGSAATRLTLWQTQALVAAAGARQWGNIHRPVDGAQHIGVLRAKLVGRERADESNANMPEHSTRIGH